MFLTLIGGLVGIVVLLTLSSIFRGYALSVLWGWFMVPTLGLPRLSVVQAIGIAMVVGYLTRTDTSDLQKKEEGTGATIARGAVLAFLYPFFALGIGWVVHKFM